MNVSNLLLGARSRADGHTYLKWRSWQFRAKDVTGIPGLAGQPWPEITVLVRSHRDCAIENISQCYMSPPVPSPSKCWDCLYEESGHHQPAYLCIQLKHRDWRRELLQQGKGEKEGRFLTTWNREIDQSWPPGAGEPAELPTWLTQRGGHIDRTTRTPSLSIQPWNL